MPIKIIFRGLITALLICESLWLVAPAGAQDRPIVGMYVHQHWSYNYPYSARKWKLKDWRGYLRGLHDLGYNTVMVWPMLDIMPQPLTSSDRQQLAMLANVIAEARKSLLMRVIIVLTANVRADDRQARRYPFQTRPFFHVQDYVDPRNSDAVNELISRRRNALSLLGKIDGLAIIDSDPGGFPGSDAGDFIHLLRKHRAMLDQLDKTTPLIYWMHVGWQAYSDWYKTGVFRYNTRGEWDTTIAALLANNPAPWVVAGSKMHMKEAPAVKDRAIDLSYGVIEGEPAFPITNFGDDAAFKAGASPGALGVIGNAQSHVVQIPNTFAFARGANGNAPPTIADYVHLGDRLIVGEGSLIAKAWSTLAGSDAMVMRPVAAALRAASGRGRNAGDLAGLVIGGSRRFLLDLALQLDVRASWVEFLAAAPGEDRKLALRSFVAAADRWQRRTGYSNYWEFPGMERALRSLGSPEIDAVYNSQAPIAIGIAPFERMPGSTPFDRIKNGFRQTEQFTPRLLRALRGFTAKINARQH